MAILRSDQSQLTFAAEAAQGGDPEMNSGTRVTSGFHAELTADVPAGSISIPYDGGTNTLKVGDFIRIGDVAAGSSEDNDATNAVQGTAIDEYEIRRVVKFTGSSSGDIILDRPTGFFHANDEFIIEVSATRTTAEKTIINRIPGVYESVTVPDMAPTIEPRYYLGTTAKRQATEFYAGQQAYSGSVGGMVLLNAAPIRFPIGKMTSIASVRQNSSPFQQTITGAKKGNMFINVNSNSNLSDDDYILLTDGTSAPASATTFSNIGTNPEVVRVKDIIGTVVELYSPLRFDHDDATYASEINFSSSDNFYTHTITPTNDLDTMSWHVHMKDSAETAANDFNRRFYGGMVDSASFAADEGGLLTFGWDTVNFLGMIHNQKNQATVSTNLFSSDSAGAGMPKFSIMNDIEAGDITFPSNNPYYFSQGTLTFFGEEVARVRNFNISISNATEPRYYISGRHDRNRGPTEIREGRKTYGMSCTVALPDTVASTASTYTGATGALEIFKQLILEGNYTAAGGMNGFDLELTFTRGTNDQIKITTKPTSSTFGDTAATTGINNQGAFITSAPHNITGDGTAMQVDLDMVLRHLQIEIQEPSSAATTTAGALTGAVYP